VVAIGIGAAGLPVDLELVGVAVLGLLLSACLWWAYFGAGDDERAEHALAGALRQRQPMLALEAFGYWHIPILLGIIATAAGIKKATGHPGEHLHTAQALQLGGGVALFMLGVLLYRRTLAIGSVRWRAGAVVAALATVPIGLGVSARRAARGAGPLDGRGPRVRASGGGALECRR